MVGYPLDFIGHVCSRITFSSHQLRVTSIGLLFLFLTISDAIYLPMTIYDFITIFLQLPIVPSAYLCRFRTFILKTLQLIVTHFIPVYLIIMFLTGIHFKLRGQRNRVAVSTRRERSQRQMLILMISSVVYFSVCTLPYSLIRAVTIPLGSGSVNGFVVSIWSLLLTANFSYNFFIHCLMSHLFREFPVVPETSQ
jgi:hypothetical protein